MRPINNWRKAWRMFSVQAMLVSGAVQGTWAALPREMKEAVPDGWISLFTVLLLVLGIAGRLVVQDKVSGGEDARTIKKRH